MVKVRYISSMMLMCSHLDVVVPIVVEVEYAVELAVLVDVDVLGVLDPLAHGLPRVLLHLDVVELSATQQSLYSFKRTPCSTTVTL